MIREIKAKIVDCDWEGCNEKTFLILAKPSGWIIMVDMFSFMTSDEGKCFCPEHARETALEILNRLERES